MWDLAIEFDFNGPMGKKARIIVIVAAILIFIIISCIIGGVYKCLKKSRSSDKVMILADETELDISTRKTPISHAVNQSSNALGDSEFL